MKIKWFGHSCFLFTSASGVKVLTDPFDSHVGYELPSVEADIVTTSHNHSDHNHMQDVKGKFIHIAGSGSFQANGIELTGIATFHDNVKGAKRGENTIFVFDIDGIRICHCGDLGHMLSHEQVEAIGRVDILLVPVGSIYTIDAVGAKEIVRLLRPSVTIPMHFKTHVLKFPLEGVERFLDITGGEMVEQQEIEITADNLVSFPKVLVLEYQEGTKG